MPTTDGRHARSLRTRAIVAEAMLDCFEDGLLRPSAKEVAERAGVSTRAVFRHFDNMESLREEAAEIQIERVMSQLPPITTEGTREERIEALVAHTTRGYELAAPVRRAALLSEPFSDVIAERHAWMRSQVRRQVRRVFARELSTLPEAERRDRIASLRALLSFSYWDELRRHERLSVAAARRILSSALHALVEP
ncbi:MAG: TetR/AcrR family transcriptional regulator [bacterium]|nr:TetR/AcrR family transcriptional regulator [bacterium]